MASLLVNNRRPAPADIGAAREALYGSFQIWLWCRGHGSMEEIEEDLRAGRLEGPFREWLGARRNRKN